MARRLHNETETDVFFVKVAIQANHHAAQILGGLVSIYEEMLKKIDFSKDTVEIFERRGNLARTTWIKFGELRFVFSYNYDLKTIELKKRSTRGEVIHSFSGSDDANSIAEKLDKVFSRK